MPFFYLPLVFVVLFDLLYISFAITHWIVSKEGEIQAQPDSIYTLKRPYDLVAFLNQEKLAKHVASHFDEMVHRKMEMDKKWSAIRSASDVEEDIFSYDEDCIKAKDYIADGDLFVNVIDYASDDPEFKQGIPDDKNIKNQVNLDCKKFFHIDFSMAAFPHFKVLYQPWNVSWPKETEIKLPLTPKQIHYGLKTYKTNWYFYNLASLYWRRKGNCQKAIDCIKSAIHLAPRQYKDTPLFNLGVMLHRAQISAEAAIVLHGAVDLAPHKPLGHFVLANVYAVLGDFNRSLSCYNNALGLDPEWRLVETMRDSIVCHYKVKTELYDLQVAIHEILVQMREFQAIQEEWLKFHEEILHQQAPSNKSFPLIFSDNKLQEKCITRKNNIAVLSCDIMPKLNFKGHKTDEDDDLASLKSVFATVQSQAQKISEKIRNPYFDYNPDSSSNGPSNEYFIPFRWDSDIENTITFQTNDH